MAEIGAEGSGLAAPALCSPDGTSERRWDWQLRVTALGCRVEG